MAIPAGQAQETAQHSRISLAWFQEKTRLREIRGRQGAGASRRFHDFGPRPQGATSTEIQGSNGHGVASR